MTFAPPPPQVRLSIGVTGHRAANHAFAANSERIAAALDEIFDCIAAIAGPAPVRLHTLLADGSDHLAAEGAIARGWELVAPLPFGRALNTAINAHPSSSAEARALICGQQPEDAGFRARAASIEGLCQAARVFELADADEEIARLFLAMLERPGDVAAAHRYSVHASERVALAGRVMIEQSDLVIGIWDGLSRAFIGGTGHTIAAAVSMAAPVVVIDANAPEDWRIMRTLESLAHPDHAAGKGETRKALLAGLVREALDAGDAGLDELARRHWRGRSNRLFHAYRQVEALFGGGPRSLRRLRLVYETPDAIGTGSGAETLRALADLPGADPDYPQAVERAVLRRFAWADGISTHLSDLYRGGMIASFFASGLAIVSGIAYLPIVNTDAKWLFALAEFLLLSSILGVTALGRRQRWHARWFETRRAAEYLRHGPVLLAVGLARAPGLWPRSTGTSWPESYARQSLREVGLPRIALTKPYLHQALRDLLDKHVNEQRDYHRAKAKRLNDVHRNLDRLSGALFLLAVISVAAYLALRAGAALHAIPETVPHDLSKSFTFLGVLFPTFGGTIAGIRYFGDFDRFAAISEVSAEKLDAVHRRAELLLAAPGKLLDYGSLSEIAKAADDIVVTEIENWQAVFAGKHISVPV